MSTWTAYCYTFDGQDQTALASSPVFYGESPDEDLLRLHDEPTAGIDDAARTRTHREERLLEAQANGILQPQAKKLRVLLHEFSDIFRTRLGVGYPADVSRCILYSSPVLDLCAYLRVVTPLRRMPSFVARQKKFFALD